VLELAMEWERTTNLIPKTMGPEEKVNPWRKGIIYVWWWKTEIVVF
jgi:hypothetical protein